MAPNVWLTSHLQVSRGYTELGTCPKLKVFKEKMKA